MNSKSKQRKNQVAIVNIFEQQEIIRKAEEVKAGLKASTWHELETKGKFTKNDKLTFIKDDMLILGCDIGSEIHYLRAIDTRGRELSRSALPFNNNLEGFEMALNWAVKLAAVYNKSQIVMGLEPTGHYWFAVATWMIAHGISVVQVNPYAVKQTKEIEDNSQKKDDRKDPKLIANLVKDGNYGLPYLPEGLYSDIRRLSMFRDQLTEDRIRCMNRLHREMRIYFPEYKEAFGRVEGIFCLSVLKEAPFPEDLTALGSKGLQDIWHQAKLRGRGYSRAGEIVRLAKNSIGLKEGVEAGKEAVKWFVDLILRIEEKLESINKQIEQKCAEIPHAEKLLEISGLGKNTLSGILAEMGDLERFDDVKEIQKLSGLSLVSCDSGKHKGETRISYRGRKRLRYWLFQAAKSVVAHAPEFQELHMYYTSRADNPLKKIQSLIVIACKLLRIIFAIMKNGMDYDPKKMLKDIHREEKRQVQAA